MEAPTDLVTKVLSAVEAKRYQKALVLIEEGALDLTRNSSDTHSS